MCLRPELRVDKNTEFPKADANNETTYLKQTVCLLVKYYLHAAQSQTWFSDIVYAAKTLYMKYPGT